MWEELAIKKKKKGASLDGYCCQNKCFVRHVTPSTPCVTELQMQPSSIMQNLSGLQMLRLSSAHTALRPCSLTWELGGDLGWQQGLSNVGDKLSFHSVFALLLKTIKTKVESSGTNATPLRYYFSQVAFEYHYNLKQYALIGKIVPVTMSLFRFTKLY